MIGSSNKSKDICLLPLEPSTGVRLNPASFVVGRLGITPARVAGNLHIDYPDSSPAKVSRIEIKLVGTKSIITDENRAEMLMFSDDLRLDNHKVAKEESLCNHSLVPFEDAQYKVMTNEKFPFSFDLSDELPSATRNEQMEVEYTLTATVIMKGLLFKSTKEVSVIIPIKNYSPGISRSHIDQSIPTKQ
ncbi:hypothetical protein GQ42DRAFT_153162 [Ramicandelaber brevisporus]|nr:hypothetical protein GQ42DRAFT_153162 [Ramicandelaber brevisporus]